MRVWTEGFGGQLFGSRCHEGPQMERSHVMRLVGCGPHKWRLSWTLRWRWDGQWL